MPRNRSAWGLIALTATIVAAGAPAPADAGTDEEPALAGAE